MKKSTKVPTKAQFKSLLKKVGQFDNDASITMGAATSGNFETSWAGLSKADKIKVYKDYMKRLGQKKGPPYRIFDKYGNPEMSD